MEANAMLVNPRERYFKNKGIEQGKLETAKNLLKKGFSVDEVVELTGWPKKDILNI